MSFDVFKVNTNICLENIKHVMCCIHHTYMQLTLPVDGVAKFAHRVCWNCVLFCMQLDLRPAGKLIIQAKLYTGRDAGKRMWRGIALTG